MYLNHLQTMCLSFEEICQGQDPWIPLGNFMNDWYAYHADRRAELVADPLPARYPEEFHAWAVFCAATVEWFCQRYDVPCPPWVFSEQYSLSEPWYFHENERVRQRLLTTTPEVFTRRNIFCGNRMFLNKWEVTVPSLAPQ
jgi:hypothetical protein